MIQPSRRWLGPLMYFATGLLCAYLLTVALPLDKLNWDIPFIPHGDGLLTSVIVRTLIDQPWYLTNAHMGAPHELNWYDFPMAEGLHFAMFKIAGLLLPNYARVLNVTFLLDFFLIACSALWVLRRMGLSYPSSVAGALLYCFAPYHFFRNEAHFFLSAYFLIPPTTLMTLWVFWREPMLRPPLSQGRIPRLTGKGVASVLLCALVGSAGVYYAFFAAFFLILAGLYQAIPRRAWRQALTGAGLSGVIVAALLLNLAPNFLYGIQHGANHQIATRIPQEAEMLGLRVFRLILPVRYHRIPAFARIYELAGRDNEAASSNLGAVASVGLILLLIGALAGFPNATGREVLAPLSVLTIWAIVLAASGGLGSVLAYAITAQIRAYNRISIYLAFFCLAAFFLIAEWAMGKLPATLRPVALTVFAAIVLTAGFLDQVPPPMTDAYLASQAESAAVEEFVHRIEPTMPDGAMILQLPYMPFPEAMPVYKMMDYEPARPYLASKSLRWSYGAPRGRHANAWLEDLTSQPLPDLCERAALAGYQGIWVDRFGYREPETQIDGPLRSILKVDPVVRRDRRDAFYDLRPFAAKLRAGYSEARWRNAQEASRYTVFYYIEGCGAQESGDGTDWYWCGDRGQVVIENPMDAAQEIEVEGDMYGVTPEPMKVELDGPGFHDVDGVGHFSRSVTIQPGRSAIRFHTDAKPHSVPGDPRILTMRFQNLKIGKRELVKPSWDNGCYAEERDKNGWWRWCSGTAQIVLSNRTDRPAAVSISMKLSAPAPAAVRIEGPGFDVRETAGPAAAEFRQAVMVPPGESRIKLTSDGKKLAAPADPRTMVFQVRDFRMHAAQ